MRKFLLLLCTLLGTVGAWATDLTLTPANGTYVTSSGNYVNSITFSTSPAITVTASANNMDKRQTGSYLLWHSGSSGSSTYTISVGDDYMITAYTVTGEANTSAQTLTAGSNSHEFAVGTSSTFTVTGLGASSVSFVQTGANASGLKITSISVTVAKPTEEQTAAYNTVQGWIPTIQSAKGLVKEAANYVSNAKSSAEGSYEALLDGDYTTYFHGAYGNQSVPNEDQYLQATLPNAVNAIYFYFKKRQQNNANRPTSITISGSNDGSSFTDITTINSGLPTDASVLDYTSSKISLGASYQYLRFTVTSTNTGAQHSNGHVFFTFSEFYILPSDTEIDDVMDLHAALAGTAAVNYTAQNIADISAANTALLSNVVDVTYALYESDGTTFVSNTVVEQEKNSAVSIPSAISNYTYYDYATTGEIGSSDCTIKVTRTLKSGYVISLDGLSNSKCYNIRNNRGTWAVGSGATDVNSTVELGLAFLASDTKQQFAFITYEGNVYLYSVSENKFAYVDVTKLSLTAAVTSAVAASPVTFQASTASSANAEPIIVTVGGQMYGVSTGMTPDVYKYNVANDGGNSAIIIEAGSFDATAALALLEEYFHPTNCYDRVEAEVIPFLMDGENPSPTIGKPFGLSSDAATSIVTTYMDQLNNKQFTLAEYEAIVAAKNAGIIYPENGKFYVIKNVSNNKYLNVKAAGGIYADVDAPTAGSIVQAQIRDGKTYFATQGKDFGWCYGETYKALLDAAGDGKYAHFSEITVPGQIAFAHCLGNGEGTNSAYLPYSYYKVDSNNQVCGGTSNDAAAQWTFEEASTFNITLNGPIDASYYATLCVPYDIELSGATAYTLTKDGTTLNMSEGMTTVDAGTPVLLVGTALATVTVGTNYSATASGSTALTGSYLEIAEFAGGTHYTLGTDGTKVGFFHWDGTTLGANRAYVAGSTGGGNDVKGFYLSFDGLVDGIKTIDNGQESMDNATIFNLAGQRLSKLQRGVNIVNGKKVLVK